RTLEVKDRLTPRLLKTLPGVEDRLAAGGDHEWTKLFLETAAAHERGDLKTLHLQKADWEALALGAVRGATGREESYAVRNRIQFWNLRSAIPEFIRLLKDGDLENRAAMLASLKEMRAR